MTSRECNQKLIKAFPELIREYQSETDWQDGDDTGSHVIYADVFVPFIKKAIKEQNKTLLNRVFVYIELLLLCSDEYAGEVVYLSVIESLLYAEDIELEEFIHFADRLTLRAIQELLHII